MFSLSFFIIIVPFLFHENPIWVKIDITLNIQINLGWEWKDL